MRPESNADDLAALLAPLIREVPDFPEPGVLFRDLALVLADATVFRAVVDALIAPTPQVDVVVGVEARGFLLARVSNDLEVPLWFPQVRQFSIFSWCITHVSVWGCTGRG